MKTPATSKKRLPKEDARVRVDTTNIFHGLGRRDADEIFAKMELAYKIQSLIGQMNMTQTKAASLLGTDRARISNLMRGQLKEFSMERLFYFLNCLGQDVEVTVRPKRQGRGRVQILAKAG
jgi:predicted XRE-type DNA-binding protein